MTIVGQFRDRRRPDRFVWIRGFPNGAPDRIESIAADSTLSGHLPTILDLEPTPRSRLGNLLRRTGGGDRVE